MSLSTIEIESRSILAGGVGRVRSQLLEFGDDYLHKPAPTDPKINTIDRIPTHIFACTGSWVMIYAIDLE